MNIAAEFQAALPEPRVILGVRLLPLSIGRYGLLKRFGSPFVEEQGVDFADKQLAEITKELFFGLVICGLPVSEFKALLQTPRKLAREARRFGKNACNIIARTPRFSILESIKQFKAFLDEGSAMPWHPMPRTGTGNDGGESVSHWSHSIEVALRARAGWLQHEIDEEPLTKALADFFKLMESEGTVDLISLEDYAFFKKTGEDNARILLAFQEGKQN